MKKRKLCMICIPMLLWFLIMGLARVEELKKLIGPWQQGDSFLVEGTIYKSGQTKTSETIYLKDISIYSKADTSLSAFTNEERYEESEILVYLKNEENFCIGDRVLVSGNLTYPSYARNPGGFNGISYYGAQNICIILKKAVIQEVKSDPDYLACFFNTLKQRITESLDAASSDTENAILKSLLLGEKSELDSEVRSLYQDNGIIHVLAISGLHISMIGMSLYQFLRKRSLSFLLASVISMVLILAYGYLTDFPTSAVRAIIMFLIYLGAQILGRTYDMPTSMTVAGILMLIRNPLLITQNGFLLSFGAIAGVFTLSMFENNRLKTSALGLSISVWLVTLPITLFFFYQVPLTGILLNLVVVPSMSFLIVFGILGTLAGFCSPLVAEFLFAPVHYILKITLWICKQTRRIPYSCLITGRPHLLQILAYYILFYGSLILFTRKKKNYAKKRCLCILLAVLLIMMKLPPGWSVTFLDVGQGDGICIHTETNHVYMIDGGSSSESALGKYTLIPYLKYYGYAEVDGWFVSHYDNDHVSGLIEILETYIPDLTGNNAAGITIRRIILPDLENEEEIKQSILNLAQKLKIPVSYVSKGDTITDGRTMIQILSPISGNSYEDSNAGSMVMKVTYKDFSLLLTGDVQGKGEEELQKGELGQIDVLKVAHHGSKNSSQKEVLQKINPRIAVISCGAGNRYGHPNQEVLDNLTELGCEIVRTDESGAIIMKVK